MGAPAPLLSEKIAHYGTAQLALHLKLCLMMVEDSRRPATKARYMAAAEAATMLLAERSVGHPLPVPQSFVRSGVVYFIQSGSHLKIGFTTKLGVRLNDLAIASPAPLRVLHQEPGTIADEHAYHKRFAALRVHREWFRNEGDLATFLSERARA